MPLGVKEILLLIRAKDLASRQIEQVGGALGKMDKHTKALGAGMITAGAAIAGVGVAATAALVSAGKASMEYDKASRLTLTQVELNGMKAGDALERIKDIGRDVAKEVPANFKDMQKTLYDIFSSLDVSLDQSKEILKQFSKTAVAGNVDVQTAGRATIAVLNAFNIKPTGDNVAEALDIQFQLVRKGVGTYEEFAKVLGRVAPSSVRAGQTFETMAGGLAFLTRNGLSAAMAAASLGRAEDSLANPTVVGRLEAMGIKVRNAKGEFNQMPVIVQQLSDKLKNLTAPERAAALQELFKGAGGTIQARRFWDTALKFPQSYLDRVSDMGKAGGQLDNAYKIMLESPQAKIDQLKNKFQVFKEELGGPVMKVFGQVADIGGKMLDKLIAAWDKLTPKQQQGVVQFIAIGAAALILIGTVITLVGVFTLLGAALSGTAGTILGIIGVVGALVAGFVLLYTHSEKFREACSKLVDILKRLAGEVLAEVKLALGIISDTIQKHRDEWQKWWVIIQAVASFFVDHIIPIIATIFVDQVKAGIDILVLFGKAFIDLIAAGANFVRWVVDKFLAALEWIVKGAAAAFGWVPIIGDQLKKAAKDFEDFRDSVNNSFNGITKGVNIEITATAQQAINEVNRYNSALNAAHPGAVSVHEMGAAGAAAASGRSTGTMRRRLQYGGDALRRASYLIGEAGPELFVPFTDGRVIPNWKLPALFGHPSNNGSNGLIIQTGAFQFNISESQDPERTRMIIHDELGEFLRQLKAGVD